MGLKQDADAVVQSVPSLPGYSGGDFSDVVTKESKMAPTANGKAGERNEPQNENHEQI
jgi:hypothetical protein